jgi:DNA topoisomerase VI subunit A
MKKKRSKGSTLFDPDFLPQFEDFGSKKLPYSIALDTLRELYESDIPEAELSIFGSVVDHEISAYEARGYIYGHLSLAIPKVGTLRLWQRKKPLSIPSFVEQDVFPVEACDASAIVLVDDEKVFGLLAKPAVICEPKTLLVTGCGIPRIATRRLIHRLQERFSVPVFLLADNDTWGYWSYSVLKRGLMAPAIKSTYSAITDLTFMGVRARDWKTFDVPKQSLRSWKDRWNLRLAYIQEQRCFQSKQWQRELNTFAQDRYALDLCTLVAHLGVDSFVKEYYRPRLLKCLQ